MNTIPQPQLDIEAVELNYARMLKSRAAGEKILAETFELRLNQTFDEYNDAKLLGRQE